MALTDKKISTYTDNVKSLSDYPSDDGVTAAQLKAIFDGRTDKEVKNAVNGIIDELTATTGAEQIKTASGNSVQTELNAHASSISGKVDKAAGKGLSTNDYTTAEKNKLSGIETGAQVNRVASVAGKTGAVTLTLDDISETTAKKIMTSGERDKLSGIETGANKTIVDSAISDTSENPVQNKEVKRLLDAKVNKNAPNVDTPILIQGEDPTGIYEPVGKITVDEHELSIIHESATLPLSPALIIGGNSLRYKEDGVEYDVYTENNKPPVDNALSDTSENPVQNKVIKSALDSSLDLKVDKISGKGLSTNDYTTSEKNKLSAIESGANKTVVDTALSNTSTNPLQNKVINSALTEKANINTPWFSGNATFSGGSNTTFSPKCKVVLSDSRVEISFDSTISPLPDKIIFGDGTLKFFTANQEYAVYTENNPQTTMWGLTFAAMSQEQYDVQETINPDGIYIVDPPTGGAS